MKINWPPWGSPNVTLYVTKLRQNRQVYDGRLNMVRQEEESKFALRNEVQMIINAASSKFDNIAGAFFCINPPDYPPIWSRPLKRDVENEWRQEHEYTYRILLKGRSAKDVVGRVKYRYTNNKIYLRVERV